MVRESQPPSPNMSVDQHRYVACAQVPTINCFKVSAKFFRIVGRVKKTFPLFNIVKPIRMIRNIKGTRPASVKEVVRFTAVVR